MIMLYFHNILRYREWKLFLVLGLLLLGLGIKNFREAQRPTMAHLTELQKCPACYGISSCDAVSRNKIKIKLMNNTFGKILASKNVFYATYGKKQVVLKKLAEPSQLEAFDENICSEASLKELCQKNASKKPVKYNIDFRIRITEAMTSEFMNHNSSKLRLCPSTEHMDDLFYNYTNSRFNMDSFSEAYLWTMVKINPEPIILQILPAEDGWPVPKYFGACGRLIVEEYVGPRLMRYLYESWVRRAKIASSLLKAARMFTFRSAEFGFYLADLTPINIAVDSCGEAKFIDLEKIIVVDKRFSPNNKTLHWNELQVNKAHFKCKRCLTFSTSKICKSHLSDHNYYCICHHLLAPNTSSILIPGGLLHHIPEDILKQYSQLPFLLEQCATPSDNHTRIEAGDQLRDILDNIVERTK